MTLPQSPQPSNKTSKTTSIFSFNRKKQPYPNPNKMGTSQLGDEYNYSDQVYDCNPIKPSVPHSGTHTYALTPLAHSP
ncbi:hypothetical protein VB712_19965, partial [Spirulina sp. CCNP1310]|uniref:hypothetical protein n=1 Tax=Spirulina sp. CCNP1310 TaxID=3110249 RepID=UPI002B20BDB9